MSNNNVINEKRKALLAYKEKILDEIKYSERNIDDFRASLKNKRYYDDLADSSDSEDDFLSAIDVGPSITQLKLQQAMKKTCLHATQELTGLMVLQSEVDVLVEEPKYEGEKPVTEAGTWREVTAECRIDLVPFTMTFFMHTPHRKFGPPSYRGLRVVPVKSSHELELANSVLHTLKVPSDAVEVLRSYAAGYRSRRTTLARLANKYTNSLFMEPHAEGGFVLKCADLLEVSWKLENKWSPVAPFHHKMKFDLEFMEESYIKIITQAHKELLDPSIQTDERTLLLAKIITTCLEVRGPIDPESDLESKTTDRDVERRESESEKRDSEVMAPPKSLPKKGKQKNKGSLPNTAEKRKIDEGNSDSGAKKAKNDAPEAKKSIIDSSNPRKSKINDVVNEGGRKRKISEVNKVVSGKTVKESGNIDDGNTKSKDVNKEDKISKAKNVTESDKIVKTKNLKSNEDSTAKKPKTTEESVSNEDKNTNNKPKNKVIKVAGDTATKNVNPKPKTKVSKEPVAKTDSNSKPKTKITKDTGKNQENVDNNKLKDRNTIDTIQNKDSVTKNAIKEPSTTEKVKNKAESASKKAVKVPSTEKVKNNANKAKTVSPKETGNAEEYIQNQNNGKTKKKLKDVANVKSKENVDINTDAGRPKNKNTEKTTNIEKNINKNEKKPKNTDAAKVKNVGNTKNDGPTTKKAPEKNINLASAKSDDQTSIKPAEKPIKVANTKNDKQTTKKVSEQSVNVASTKNDKQTTKKAPEKDLNVASTKTVEQSKKVIEKKDKNKEKLPEVANKASQKIIKENPVKNDVQTVKKVTEKNATNVRNKDKISQINTKDSEQIVKNKPTPTQDIPEKVLNSNLNTKNKNIIKKPPIMPRIASHRNSLKPLNPPKVLKVGNTKIITTGNTEKENGVKGSKIPQKKLSMNSEGSSKKNFLRMSPRVISSKAKMQPQASLKQNVMKYTNIPRLLKKPAPKTT